MKPSSASAFVSGQFRALGTEVEYAAAGDVIGFEVRLRAVAEAIEEVFSRFRPTSELSRLNAVRTAIVSPLFGEVLELARQAATLTDGIVDPTILSALVAAGYDRDFEQLRTGATPSRATAAAKGTGKFHYESQSRVLMLTPGTQLDLAGVAKGFAVDRMGDELAARVGNGWVGIGGDLTFVGGDPDGEPRFIAVQDPADLAADIGTIELPAAGRWSVATSGITARKGIANGRAWHHLIDPRTGSPADTDVLGVTVVDRETWRADVFAKAAVILGSTSGEAFLRRCGVPLAIITTFDRRQTIVHSETPVVQFTPARS